MGGLEIGQTLIVFLDRFFARLPMTAHAKLAYLKVVCEPVSADRSGQFCSDHAVQWAHSQGCKEMGSTRLGNEISFKAH